MLSSLNSFLPVDFKQNSTNDWAQYVVGAVVQKYSNQTSPNITSDITSQIINIILWVENITLHISIP